MHNPGKSRTTTLTALAAGLLLSPVLLAGQATSGIFINGVELSPQQMAMLYQTMGISLPPGHYLVQGGCVAHLESGQTQCAPQAQQYGEGLSQYGGEVYGDGSGNYSYGGGAGGGYGSGNDDGSWFQRGSDYSGGYSVGSDSNGCIYTPDWSNC